MNILRVKFYHEACFSNLAVSQEANLERNHLRRIKIGIGIESMANPRQLQRTPTVHGGHRRAGGEAAVFFRGFSRRTRKNSIPYEAKEVTNEGDSFEEPPPDEPPAELGHGDGGVMGYLGSEKGREVRELELVFAIGFNGSGSGLVVCGHLAVFPTNFNEGEVGDWTSINKNRQLTGFFGSSYFFFISIFNFTLISNF